MYAYFTQDLRDKTGADDETKADLTAGIEASNRVLMQANAAVDRELRAEALEDLCVRVDDWKNHRVDHFGELLQHGHFPVVTGKSDVQKEVRPLFNLVQNFSSIRDMRATKESKRKATLSSRQRSFAEAGDEHEEETSCGDVTSPTESWHSSEDQRYSADDDLGQYPANMIFHQFSGLNPSTGEPVLARQFANETGIICPLYEQYTIYLFERILLCCKEVNPNKSKDKLMGTQKDKKDKKDKNRNKEPNRNAKLQLKGRIFMTNVTEVMSLAKQGKRGRGL